MKLPFLVTFKNKVLKVNIEYTGNGEYTMTIE